MLKQLYLLILLMMFSGYSFAWTPTKFQVYCGQPYVDAGVGGIAAVVASDLAESLKSLNSRSYQFYAKLFGIYDPDVAGNADCVSQARKTMIEGYAAEILQKLKAMGFASPSPKRLGPVVSTPQGSAVRLYAVDGYSSIATTLSPCSGGKVDDARMSIMKFNSNKMNNTPPPMIYYILAHEMVHMVQNAQPILLESDRCGLPKWLGEGTADAIATYLTQKKFKYRPSITTGIGKNMHGLRPYNKNLAWENSAKLPDYRTSSFWRYLAERYYGNKISYLSDYYAIPDLDLGKDDWFSWLDTVLHQLDGGPKKPLYLVFPDFVANYANWGTLKFKNIGEKAWLREAFGGCHQITLSPPQPKRGLNLELEPISAQCIKINVGGVNAGEIVSIKLMAYDATSSELDNLHLSAAYLEGKLTNLGTDFNCYRDSKKFKSANCASKPFTGNTSPTATSSGQFAKTWLSEPQEVVQNNFKNLFMISHVPVHPSQQKHANQVKQKVALQIALERTTLKTDTKGESKKTKAKVGLKDSGEVGLIPMAGSEGFSLADLSSPDAMSKLPFLMNVPDIGDALPFEGFRTVTIDSVDLVQDEFGGAELETSYSINLFTEEAIDFGATGTYKAFVFGSFDPTGMNIGNMLINLGPEDSPSGQIQVHEYSEQLLHLTASGMYCLFTNMDVNTNQCRQPESFSAEIIRPFGWTYTSDGFSSIDTPGMAIYREHIYRSVLDIGIPLPPLPLQNNLSPSDDNSPDNNSSETSSTSDTTSIFPATPTTECDCSCEEFNAFEAMTEEMDDQVQDSQMMSLPPAVEQMMQCLGTCMMEYAMCE